MDRNWSAVHVAEPVWRHQRAPARSDPLQVLEPLAARTRYRRGQEIYKEDSPVECWYRIVSGVARRFSARADGKRQIVDLLLPGDVFGFGGSGKHHFAAEAVLDDTVVARSHARAWRRSPTRTPVLRENCETPPRRLCHACMP